MTTRPTVVVLAAGRGARFAGSVHKLAHEFHGGTVLGSTLRHVVATHLPLVVVCTEAMAELARCTVAARDTVLVPDVGSGKPAGMGWSIAAGVAARPHAGGWLILPGDMPLVRPETILAVAEALRTHPVAYAQHRGKRGHPVAFDSELYSELIGLDGDDGARRLIARYPAYGVEVDDAGVLADIDTHEDLRRLAGATATVR